MAKKLKVKVPKRIAGVKIPKHIRKGALGSFVNSRAGQIVLAECLLLAGGALATVMNPDTQSGHALRRSLARGRRVAGKDGQKDGQKDGERGGQFLAQSSSRLVHAFEQAAAAFREALLHGESDFFEPDPANDDGLKDVTPPGPGAKKKSSSRAADRAH